MVSPSPDSSESAAHATKGVSKSRYDELSAKRQPYLDRARDCSALTLPYLIPPDDMPEGQKLPSLYQSVGANGVTNLASKLLLTMLPPNEPCFRLRINNMVLEEQQEQDDKEFRTKIDKALSRVEQSILADIESTSDRPVVNEGNMHLIVGGNVLYHNDKDNGLRMFPLSRFVVDRDSMGNAVEIIVREEVSVNALPEAFLKNLMELEGPVGEVVRKKLSDADSGGGNCEVELYTHLKRSGKKWKIHQECLGKTIPGTVGSYKLDECPWFPVRMYSVAGENYGRSFVEQQIGDLNSLESLNQALVEASVVSAKMLFFVNPNGFTPARAVAEAENGAVLEGNAQDVTALQVQKGADLQVTATKIQALEQSLKTAFLMMDGIRRDAERVTAEEIRIIAQELESGLGGVYTVISQEFQLPYIRSRMAAMTRQRRIPELPGDIVAPAIVTGFEAIGRGNDKTKLVEFLQFGASTFGQSFLSFVNPSNAIMRLASSMGIATEGLIKSEEELMGEQQQQTQQAQQQAMMEKLGPEVIRQGGAMLQNQQAQPEQNPEA
ncbi:MAG: portal protein [Desulfovibrio sp.]|uniref:portal protein n=1 Tax=Desulfovibrio sp. TaxID=885 RepID=UPI002582F4D7|nr:portal protein [Desulfovibrio sp.]MCD7983735.1 portal protein [Desulfovibrio sp.]